MTKATTKTNVVYWWKEKEQLRKKELLLLKAHTLGEIYVQKLNALST